MIGPHLSVSQRRRRAVWLPLCALVLLFGRAASVHGQATPATVDIPIEVDEAVADWALDLHTGRIFAAWMLKDVVAEYDPTSGKEVRRFTVGQEPRHLVVKGRMLVAATSDPAAVWFIDLERNEVLPPVALPAEPKALFCSAADNPFVYVLGKPSGQGDTVWQIDSRERRILGNLKGDIERSTIHANLAAVSFDGLALMVNESYLFVLDEKNGKARQLLHFTDFRQRRPLGLDQNSRYWTVGGNLYPLDLRIGPTDKRARQTQSALAPRKLPPPLHEFEGSPIALHPTLDLVAGIVDRKSQTTLVLQTFRGDGEPTRITLNDRRSAKQSGGDRNATDEALLMFDAARNRLFYGRANNAHVIRLPDAGFAKPMLKVIAPAWLDLAAGQSLNVPLRVNDDRQPTTFRASGGPDSLQIDGGRLTWQPGTRDAGTYRVRVEATAGEETDTIDLEVRVTRSFIDLGMFPARVVLDRKGARAAVIGMEKPHDMGMSRTKPSTELAVVDLASQKVLARRSFPDGIRLVHLDSDRLYFVPSNGTLFHTLHVEDLTDDQRVFFDRSVTGFVNLPGNRLLVIAEDLLKCYEADRLREISCPGCEDQPLPLTMRHRGSQHSISPTFTVDLYAGLVTPVNGGVLFNGVVLDDLGTLRSIHYCGRLVAVGEPIYETRDVFFHTPEDVSPRLWGRELDGRRLVTSKTPLKTDTLAELRGPSVLLGNLPLVATAKLEVPKRESPASGTIDLVLSDLVEAQEMDRWTVCEESWIQGTQPLVDVAVRSDLHVLSAGESVVLVTANRMYVLALDPNQFARVPVPVHFLHPPHALAAEAGEPVEFALAAEGGKGKLRFGLSTQQAGVTLDEATGKVQIDTQAVWQRFREQAREMIDLPVGRGVETLLADGRRVYQRLLGKATTGVPVALTLRWRVSDEEQQEDRFSEQIIIVGPQADLDAALAEAKRERDRLVADEQAKTQASTVPPAPAPAAAPSSPAVPNAVANGEIRVALAELSTTRESLDRRERELAERNALLQGRVAALSEIRRSQVGRFREYMCVLLVGIALVVLVVWISGRRSSSQ
jgi:hypothetical protein